jgi:hypothetical protein
MTGRTRLALAALGLALCAGSVFAEEKVFVLKNGRRIRGDLVSQTADDYSIKTENGKVTLAKSLVQSIEDPPPPPKPFLEPDAPKPLPKDDDDESTPAATRTPAPAPAPVEKTPPSASAPTSSSPLAKPEEIDKLRKAILALPEVRADEPGTETARQSGLDTIAKTTPLAAIVALACENVNAAGKPTPERDVALELAAAKPDKARPLVAQAIVGFDTRSRTEHLLKAIQRIGDDPAGTLEKAILVKLDAQIAANAPPDVIYELLAPVATQRVLAPLFEKILKAAPGSRNAVEVCKKVLEHVQDSDAALAPILKRLKSDKAPALDLLPALLDLLACSHGAAGEAIDRLFLALDAAPPSNDAADASRQYGITKALEALGSISTPDSCRALVSAFDAARNEERRLAVLRALRGVKKNNFEGGTFFDVLHTIVDRMNDPVRSVVEKEAFRDTLQALTGQNFGIDAARWQEYVSKLGRE